MQIIKKVLNSSVVLVEDERGVERVLLGKGIGFGQKPGAEVPASATDQEFVSLPDADHRNLVELLAQIPAVYVELTRAIVVDATAAGLDLDPHVYLTLTDHLHFAVERQQRGLTALNRLAWEMRTVYPDQYAVGLAALDRMAELLGIRLGDDEAANIAFHLVNADLGKPGVDSMRVVELIARITTIVSLTSSVKLDRGDLHSSRFVTHLQFFAERFFAGTLLVGDDDFLYRTLSERSPRAIATAERVRSYIQKEFSTSLPDEEVAFLALHIARATPE